MRRPLAASTVGVAVILSLFGLQSAVARPAEFFAVSEPRFVGTGELETMYLTMDHKSDASDENPSNLAQAVGLGIVGNAVYAASTAAMDVLADGLNAIGDFARAWSLAAGGFGVQEPAEQTRSDEQFD